MRKEFSGLFKSFDPEAGKSIDQFGKLADAAKNEALEWLEYPSEFATDAWETPEAVAPAADAPEAPPGITEFLQEPDTHEHAELKGCKFAY